MEDEIVLIDAAIKAITEKWLYEVRARMRLSRNAMAKLIGVAAESLRVWEGGTARPWTNSLIVLGRWVVQARQDLAEFQQNGPDMEGLVPLYLASAKLSTSETQLAQECTQGRREHYDAGSFGLYLNVAELARRVAH